MDAATPIQYHIPAMPQDSALPVRKHPKFGVASFLIALGFPPLLFALFAILYLLQGRIESEAFTDFLIILGALFVGLIVHFVGLALGIAGASQKECKKLFAILGIVVNGILVFLAVAVCLLLMAFSTHPFPLGPK